MKLQINLRNGQYITAECIQNEYDVFAKDVRSQDFQLLTIPGTKYDLIQCGEIISIIEVKQPAPCTSIATPIN